MVAHDMPYMQENGDSIIELSRLFPETSKRSLGYLGES